MLRSESVASAATGPPEIRRGRRGSAEPLCVNRGGMARFRGRGSGHRRRLALAPQLATALPATVVLILGPDPEGANATDQLRLEDLRQAHDVVLHSTGVELSAPLDTP